MTMRPQAPRRITGTAARLIRKARVEVAAQALPPLGVRQGVDPTRKITDIGDRRHAGVVHQDVEPAPAALDGGDHLL
jgi:hypothetical protein